VRVCNHCGDAVGQHETRELTRAAHRRFDVHVRVDQARHDQAPVQVNYLVPIVAMPNCSDAVTGDGELGFQDLAGEDVDHAAIRQQKVGGLIAARDGKKVGKLHLIHRASCQPVSV